MNKRILHIVSLIFAFTGLVLIHQVLNQPYETHAHFFGLYIRKGIIIDIGIFMFVISYFIEFYLSFKPIKIEE